MICKEDYRTIAEDLEYTLKYSQVEISKETEVFLRRLQRMLKGSA